MTDHASGTFTAIRDGDLEALTTLLDRDPSLAAARDEIGVSLLMHALYHRRKDMADAILSRRRSKLDVFELSALGLTDQLRAALDAATHLARETSPDGFTPLHLAAFFGHADCVRLLIERGADASAVARNQSRVTPLHSALAARSQEIVTLLLDAGAPVDAQQAGGWTAVHAAALHDEVELVRLLLDRGADSSIRSDDGQTAGDLAREKNHPRVLALLGPEAP